MSCAILLALFSNLVQADTASAWPYQHIDKRAKLSNSAITSVFMDHYDHIWLGTWDGLDRYDGSNIRVYKPDPALPSAISNNIIRNFLEDGKKNLWIITHLGINKYNRTSDSFRTYLDSLNDIPFLEYNIRACVGEDSVIWTSLIGKGISRYSAEKDTFLPVHFEGIDPLWLTTIVDLGFHNGLLYLLGSDGKLVCTLHQRVVFSKQVTPSNQSSLHQFLLVGGQFFLALTAKAGELSLYNLEETDKVPAHIFLGHVLVSSLSENLKKDALWVGTETGDLYTVSRRGDGFIAQNMNAYFPAFAKARIKILTITETRQDLLWVGTDGDGVYKFLTRPKTFYSLAAGPAENGQLSHNIIRSVFEDEYGNLLVGTRGGGLNTIDPRTGKTSILNSRNGLSNDAVLAINKDHKGNLWIGVDGEGIDMIEAGTNKVLHFPRDFSNGNDLYFSSVYSICVDAFDGLWLGTSGFGIIHLTIGRTANGKYLLKSHDQLSHSGKASQVSLKSNIVYAIVEEKPNILWFGTRGGGVYRYNSLTCEIDEHIQANGNSSSNLCNNDILSLYLDRHEQLWIGTSGGLNRLSLSYKPHRIDHYTQRNGLANNTIHAILADSAGRLWLSTNHGLVIFEPNANTFKSFDTNDGLQNNEFTDGAAFRSRISERLYFGGVDGLDIVHPSKLNTSNNFPHLAITEFQVRNVAIAPGDATHILQRNIDFTDSIRLNYDQNFISLLFTTLDYWNKQKSEYSYFLENFDKGWNLIGQQQSITLTNIPPGQYKLYLNYTNENGVWNAKPRVLYLTVTPPFWKSAWAYLIYLALAIALQAGFIYYIRMRLRAKKAMAMARFREGQLKELNDYKLQFFTNIAHEFRTPLTLILGPVTTLLAKSRDAADARQLAMIYNNSIKLQKLIEELMLFRKIESGKDQLEIASVDLIPFTQQIVESFRQYAVDGEIHLEFIPEPETLPAWVDHKKLERILINLISNAIKYNTKGGMVVVHLSATTEEVCLSVRDDGKGISESLRGRIFESFYQNPEDVLDNNGFAKSTGIGLSLTKSLVHLHHGQIRVESAPGQGSTFTVTLPITESYYVKKESKQVDVTPTINLDERISIEFESHPRLNDLPERIEARIPGNHSYSILVVDDHPQITSLLEGMLSEKYNVYRAENGTRALAILEEERIDLVISDVLMPGMDGLTLCKIIKERIQTSHIPVILLTAKGEIENRIEGLQVGADSYIPKPFHPEHLFVRIEKLLERMEQIRRRFSDFARLEIHTVTTGIGEKEDDFFVKISRCIQKHLNEPEFNATIIAEEVGMSKPSLYKKVKTLTGLTPHGLIKQYRLKKASELLRGGTMSVSEVIDETGFNSRSYFYKSFNEMFHCHPKDFS